MGSLALAKLLRAHWKVTVVSVALALAVVAFAFCRPRDNPIPTKDAGTLDSLIYTWPTYQAAQVAQVKIETTYVAKSNQAARASDQAGHRADSIAVVADSLERVAKASDDTLSKWRVVAMVRDSEATAYRISRDSARSALTEMTIAKAAADVRADSAEKRRADSEDLNRRLARDVKTVNRCTILWTVRCPSRTETFIGTVLITAAASYVALRR